MRYSDYYKKVMLVTFPLYDFTDVSGFSIITPWRQGLTQRSKGALDQKLDMLYVNGMELPPKLLAGPIKKTGHIYKLKIHADVMLRPMFCKGPLHMDEEFTLLTGACEIQSKLFPDPQVAVNNRNTLIRDSRRRILHDRAN